MTTEQKEALRAVEEINELLVEQNDNLYAPSLEITLSAYNTLISLLVFANDCGQVEITLYDSENETRGFIEDEVGGHYEPWKEFLIRAVTQALDKLKNDLALITSL